jgi:hypothetical protein
MIEGMKAISKKQPPQHVLLTSAQILYSLFWRSYRRPWPTSRSCPLYVVHSTALEMCKIIHRER